LLIFFIGRNRNHGIVTFYDEESVNTLMNTRPHRVDGQQVTVHRSVPNQTLFKWTVSITHLLVSCSKQLSRAEQDLKSYFEKYGIILNVELVDEQFNRWDIHFEEQVAYNI
jgi:hypothetical protein